MHKSLERKPFRYLIAGGWNTVFGYLSGVGFYILLSDYFHITMITAISNIIAITMSFLTYKLYVFRTPGNWLIEYGKSYIVYGSIALLSIAVMWVLVDLMTIKIWYAQAFMILITSIVSYIGHKFFTFQEK